MSRPSKQDYRYHDDGNVALYRRPNSAMWYARCKLEDGTALNPFSTGAEDEAEAVKAARKRIMFAQVDQERGLDPGGKTFAFIAEQWLKMMRNEVEKKISTKAKVDAYEAITRRYHIPYFNKTKITEITPKSLAAYETWRAEYWTSGPGAVAEFETITRKDGKTYKRKTKRVARGKMDAEDTVLRQIFKFAVKEEYLPVARMPTIGGKKQVGNGTQSTRRPAFTKEQAGKLLDYDANAFYPITAKMDAATVARLEDDRMVFKAWLSLMLGTGIRPGKEHHGIKWKHFEQHDDQNGKPVEETPQERMRSRMTEHLTEQLAMATALVEGRPYAATRTVTKKNEDGSTVTVERDKRLRPWYWHDLSGKWFLELRYANTVLSLAKDQNAIEIGTKDKLVPTIQTVIEAVNAGELDAAMNAALASRKKPGKAA